MNYQKYFSLLKENGQEHLLQFWSEFTDSQKNKFIQQVKSIDFNLLNNLILKTKSSSNVNKNHDLKPANVVSLLERQKRDSEMKRLGEEILRQGKMAVFLVAGGQGSRLGFKGPKGAYPISPIKNKTLFQLHAEKILALSNYYQCTIPWYIMTSESNHTETIHFYKEHDYFGLDGKDIMFFKQEMIPAVDYQGKFFLEEKDRIFKNPNGHGGSLKAVWDSGAFNDMKNRGIEYLFYFQVDNVLINMCDPIFLGYHVNSNSEMSSKVVRKAYPEEKMGVIFSVNGKTCVIEYSNLNKENTFAVDDNGHLVFWAGSIAIHLFNLTFIEKENVQGFKLPYHLANKKIPFVDLNGKKIIPNETNGFKFETFVFDALPHCENSLTLEVDREDEFSALKNKNGVDSPVSAKNDMIKQHLRWLKNAGIKVSEKVFAEKSFKVEISPLFAVSEEILQEKKQNIGSITHNFYLE